jgi:hypothetical protein
MRLLFAILRCFGYAVSITVLTACTLLSISANDSPLPPLPLEVWNAVLVNDVPKISLFDFRRGDRDLSRRSVTGQRVETGKRKTNEVKEIRQSSK